MALNKIFASTQERHRERPLADITAPSSTPSSIQPGTPVAFADGGAVALTASGGAEVTQTTGLPEGVSSITYANGGVGNAAGAASFAFDGTWEFEVTGVTTSTASGVEVYIGTTGALTTSSGGGAVHFGWTDYPRDYRKQAGRAPVRIGA